MRSKTPCARTRSAKEWLSQRAAWLRACLRYLAGARQCAALAHPDAHSAMRTTEAGRPRAQVTRASGGRPALSWRSTVVCGLHLSMRHNPRPPTASSARLCLWPTATSRPARDMSYTVASSALTSNARCLAASTAASSSCMICARRGAAPSQAPPERPRRIVRPRRVTRGHGAPGRRRARRRGQRQHRAARPRRGSHVYVAPMHL
jgi:hypothetical protein